MGGKDTKNHNFTLDTQNIFDTEISKQNREELAVFTQVSLAVEPRKEVRRLAKPPLDLKDRRGSHKTLHAQVQKTLPMPPKGLVKYKKDLNGDQEGDWAKSGRLTKMAPKPLPYP